jgi:hypothetical protein
VATPLEGGSIVLCRMRRSTTNEVDEGRIRRFSAVVVTDPDSAKQIVYGSGAAAPRFAGKPSLTPSPAPSLLADKAAVYWLDRPGRSCPRSSPPGKFVVCILI